MIVDSLSLHFHEQDVQWLQTITKLPILVKGVLTGEDGELPSDKQMATSLKFNRKHLTRSTIIILVQQG